MPIAFELQQGLLWVFTKLPNPTLQSSYSICYFDLVPLIIILFLNTACLYIACRQEGVPRTFKEIVAVSTVSKKEIGRCFKVKFFNFF